MARTEKAGITFAAAARIRSDRHAGPTWAAKDEKPVVQAPGSRHGMSLMPATPSRGKMPLMIKDKCGINAAVFIAFLQWLIAGARGVILLIVDRGPAHAAKKTRAFGERVKGSLRLFYRPPYSPERNPDALVWKYRKADTVGCMAVSRKDDFESKARSSMRQRQTPPAKIRSLYQ
jgi:DDE superfamily endonuclease